MSPRWFRVAYARNAFLRHLAQAGMSLDTLTPAQGARAMVRFRDSSRPQHGVLDELECAWAPSDSGMTFAVIRRLQREGQPEAPLRLEFTIAASVPEPGRASVTTVSDIAETEGYHAIGRARIVARALTQP